MTDLQVPSVGAADVMAGGFQVVDVRSPGEFADGHMPGAINLPFLDDLQRGAVGVAYREGGGPQARVLAMELVTPSLVDYVKSLAALAGSQPRGHRLAIMCWRGGERSRNVVLLLALIGVHAVRVTGGYQAYRRQVLAALEQWQPPVPVLTLHGQTGAGKSSLIRALQDVAPTVRGMRPWPVDLEALAQHRGSLLGGLNQPAERRQKDFDALLWDELRRAAGDYLVLEGEGGKIGRVFLPGSVAGAIRGGMPVLVTAPLAARVDRILREYDPSGWGEEDAERFRQSLRMIGARLSRETVLSLETAFDDGRFTDVVEGLLVEYYDPLYQRSSVEGRDFVLGFATGPDPVEDARRFAHTAACLIREVSSDSRA
ncbi:MAG: tRNA 2-selenouridine(34) synthase MnmH [Thermoleophilia bacterium]|nr:tRNA 2-selenouridine(34) synthase MnmH [Thermoleophilia bacterium]